MGSNISHEENRPLLRDCEEISPIFEELRLVIIGNHGAGKNTIGNAILKKKVFTFWTSLKSSTVKKNGTVSGSNIYVARTPGWKGELNKSEKIQNEIENFVHSSYSTGLHAVLLVIKVPSVLSDTNIRTLESLLTVQLWTQTIIIFLRGENLKQNWSFEDYISCNELQTLIHKCEQRYFVIPKNDTSQIIDTIEYHILKKSSSFFKLLSQVDNHTLISNLRHYVERIKSKITSISNFKESFKSAQNDLSIQKLLDSKDAEIKRLQTILEEKEKEIKSLQARAQDPESFIRTLTNDLKTERTENEKLKIKVNERDTEIEELREEVQKLQDKEREWKAHKDQLATTHACCRSELNVMQEYPNSSCQSVELRSRGPVLPNWNDTLLLILEMLSNYEIKKMEYYMVGNYLMSINSEPKDRVDLAKQMQKQWGERKSVKITQELLKKLPRNDDAITDLIKPFLMKHYKNG